MADITIGGDVVSGGRSVNTPYDNADSKQVSVDDFLQLMIAQLRNQDFTNPVDDSQYVTQLAQFASMQQMQELAYYSKSNYVMSLVGKDVTAARLGIGGAIKQVTGPVEKIALSNKEFMIYVNGEGYSLSQIMSVNDSGAIIDTELADVSKMAVVLEQLKGDEAKIRWDPAVKGEEAQKKIKYSVYISENESFDSVAAVKKGDLVGDPESAGLKEAHIKNLKPGTTYFVNVIAKAESGKEAVYQKLVFTTKDE